MRSDEVVWVPHMVRNLVLEALQLSPRRLVLIAFMWEASSPKCYEIQLWAPAGEIGAISNLSFAAVLAILKETRLDWGELFKIVREGRAT